VLDDARESIAPQQRSGRGSDLDFLAQIPASLTIVQTAIASAAPATPSIT
jgi:hypothetical protein